MKVAVTGGSGQLGTLVLRRLLDDRAVKEVVSLDTRPPLLGASKLRAERVDVRDGDLERHFAGCAAVFHFAFLLTRAVPRALADAVNVGGSRNVFESAVAAGARQIIYSSSIAAYGVLPGHPVPLLESSPRRYQPGFMYAATKWEIESFLDRFEPLHPEVAIARLRPAILVGARMDPRLGDAWRRRVMFDLGGAPLPLVWDEDAADAAILAFKRRARGAFLLAADEPQPIEILARAAGLRRVKISRAAVAPAVRLAGLLARAGLGEATDPAWIENLGPTMLASSAKARAELGWKPRCPTAIDVLKRFVATVPAGADARLGAFFRVVDLAARRRPPDTELRGLSINLHLELTGPHGGDYTLRAHEGRVTTARGAPRPPGATVTMSAELFRDLLAGRADFSTAQMTGRIRTLGQGHAFLFVQGMIATFRSSLAQPGVAGAVPRLLARWIAGGATAPSVSAS